MSAPATTGLGRRHPLPAGQRRPRPITAYHLQPAVDHLRKGGRVTAIRVTHEANTCYRVAVGRHLLTIDQPEDAGGEDLGPTAVQLFAASLVACTAHYAGSYL